jgi:hypothetical protein
MQMTKWASIIENLTEGSTVTVDPVRWNLDNPEYQKIFNIWKQANFNFNSIKWTNYYPGVHFSSDVVDQQKELLKLTKVHRSWISKIDSGYMAPWHWDVDDNEEEYLKYGSIVRYTVIVEEMAHGHILIIGNDHYYNQPANTVIRWTNYKEWHSGINAGMSPNYLFHILGS